MKRLLPVVIAATLAAGTAHAGVPIFSAECPTGINVDADRKGTVRINGKKAKVKKVNNEYYEARGAGVTISVAINPDKSLTVSYTGKHRANGMCQVLAAAGQPGAPGGGAAAGSAGSQRESTAARAGQGKFDATGQIPCAQHKGQPMGQCKYGVARDPGGTATVVVTRPDGRTRAIFFEKGKAVSADLSQADGNMTFHATKESDLFLIRAGDERYEIPEAVITGG